MFTEYLDCRIEILPRNGDVFPFSIHAPGGDARGSLRLPTDDSTYKELANKLAQLSTDEDILMGLGQALFEALFQGSAKQVLTRSQGVLKAEQGLRIVLNIAAEEQEVGALPWEFIYDSDQGPLALLDTPIVRYLPQQAVAPALKTDLPLKILLTGAQPSELAKINVEQELKEVESALADLVAQGRVQIVSEPHLTSSKLQRLVRQNFHVWHFAGHGGFRQDGKTGALAFEDPQGDLAWASAPELGILLNRSVRLIVLDACESGQLTTSPFRSMAPALMRAQTAAVIAMQFKVLDRAARAFAGEFYRALAEGFPVDACVTEGRRAVMGAVGLARPDWGIPVVYTRAPDGKLFELPAVQPAATPPPRDEVRQPTSKPAIDTAQQIEVEETQQIQSLEAQAEANGRQVNILKLKKARMGINTDASTLMDLEDNERAQIAAVGQIVDIWGARVKRREQAGGAASQLDEARRELLQATIRRKTLELRVLERKATDFGGSRTPYDAQIEALKSQIAELQR